MNDDEIVRALRENAEWCDANEYDVPLCMGDNQRQAASLIESLQAKLSETEARANDKEDMYRDKIRELTAQLAASQRREQAAVDDMKHKDNCDVCKYSKYDGGCDESNFDCETCKNTCPCATCRNESNWQWRGPQEAGKEKRNDYQRGTRRIKAQRMPSIWI